MRTQDFSRNDCQLGHRRVTYTRLERDYRCEDCGGRIVVRWSEEGGWYPACASCDGQCFIHEREAQQQAADAVEVLDGLPPGLAALVGYKPRHEGEPVLFPLGQQDIEI